MSTDIGSIISSIISGLPDVLGQKESKLNGFLQISGIKGESKQKDHKDQIEALDYHWSVTQPRSASASSVAPLATERAHFGDLVVYKVIDLASPDLAHACANGTHIDWANFYICRSTGIGLTVQPYMEYKMTGVIITSFRSGSHGYGETLPLEEVSLSYGTIEWKYTKLDETSGDPVGTAVKKWDLKGNR